MTKTLKRKLRKILDYAIDAEMDHYLGCIGERGYKSHILVTTVQTFRILSGRPPKCIWCDHTDPFTEDGMFCRNCAEDELGFNVDENGKYYFPDNSKKAFAKR